jgi:mRNA interferase RelE/StbE
VASYSLEIKRSAVREIEALPTKKARRLLVNRISRLADDPHPPGAEKLAADDRYRVRQGPYRIVYRVDDAARMACVVKVGHRREREVYRR